MPGFSVAVPGRTANVASSSRAAAALVTPARSLAITGTEAPEVRIERIGQWRPEHGAIRKVEIRRHDPDDRVRNAIEHDRATDWAPGSAPKRSCHIRSPRMTTRGLPGVSSSSTKPRPLAGETPRTRVKFADAMAPMISAGSPEPVSVTRLPPKLANDSNARLLAVRSSRNVRSLITDDPGDRERLRHMREKHELFWMVERQRPQEHAVDDREHRRRRADAEREREHGDDGERRRSAQATPRIGEIAPQRLEAAATPHIARYLRDMRDVAELETSVSLGVGARFAAFHAKRNRHLEMRVQLAVELELAIRS